MNPSVRPRFSRNRTPQPRPIYSTRRCVQAHLGGLPQPPVAHPLGAPIDRKPGHGFWLDLGQTQLPRIRVFPVVAALDELPQTLPRPMQTSLDRTVTYPEVLGDLPVIPILRVLQQQDLAIVILQLP